MTRMESRPVQITQVYAQDTAPTDERDGVLWVDTSEPSRPVYAYSSDTADWEPASPGNVTVSDTAPTGESEGHLWVDTSAAPPKVKTLDSAGNWVLPKVLYSEVENTPHEESFVTAGTAAEESVTFATAFSSTPVVTSTVYSGGVGSYLIAEATSVSTTGASVHSWPDGSTGTAEVKSVMAREQT